jgi:uncharacterized tellurite resistance protein B-like protein
MLATIQSFIESAVGGRSDVPEEQEHSMQLAAAALLVEVAAADFSSHPEERVAISKALQSSFGITEKDLQDLMADAERHHEDATSLYEFTRIINKNCDQQEKCEILVNLWRVAFADGELDKYEDHRIRRIAELLNLSHREFIQAKLRVAT